MGHVGFAWIVPAWIAIGALPFAAGAIYRRWQYGPRHHTPAAPDNTPGRDPELLWECRRIHAQPTTNQPRKETP